MTGAFEQRLAKYDFHLHTYWSYDATVSPERYFVEARRRGLRYLAITDHHVIDAAQEVDAVAKAYPEITVIRAAELSVTTSIGAVDLLCYGLPRDIPDVLQRVFERYHAWQRETGAALSCGLLALGHDFTETDRQNLLQSYRPPKTIRYQGLTHIKNAILQKHCLERGFIADVTEYAALLHSVRERTHFPPYPGVADVVPAVKEAGAVVAIAHPYGYFNKHDLDRMDMLRDECGLDGIECANPGAVPPEYTERYRDYCLAHGLFSVGGSDSHSERDLADRFARHGGANEWLDGFLDCLPYASNR